MLLVMIVAGAAACGPTEPSLPRVEQFRGAECVTVAEPVVQVAAAERALRKKPEKSDGPLTSMTDAQNRLRALPAGTVTKLPEIQDLVTAIGIFRLRVDTHSADDAALQTVGTADDQVIRRCTG